MLSVFSLSFEHSLLLFHYFSLRVSHFSSLECLTRARDTLCPEDAFPRKDLKALKKEWSHAAERVADLFLQLPAEVRGVRVSDYLEFLGFAAVGTAKKISVYLEACVPQ